MLPARHLPALAAAERALGRLDAARADAAVRDRHTPDALRRTVLASLRLDGMAVAEEDVLLIDAAPDAVVPGARTAATRGAGFVRFAAALDTGRFRAETGPPSEGPPHRPVSGGVAAAGLQAALEGLALLDSMAEDRGDAAAPGADKASEPAPRPWSLAWAIAAFHEWLALEELPGTVDADTADALAAGIHTVERTLAGGPGLAGAGRVLLHLHHRDDPPVHRRAIPDPFEDPLSRHLRERGQAAAPMPRFWPVLARLAAPALLRRACGLDHAYLPLAAALATAPDVFRTMLIRPESDGLVWVLERIVEQAAVEQDRVREIEHLDAARRDALMGQRRDASAWALLDHLWATPAVTVRQTAARLGITERAARTVIATLRNAGILRGVPGWTVNGDPPQPTARPLIFLTTRHAAARPRPKPRPRRLADTPVGALMHWQPIATAPHDGRRCLVWAGRPAFAVFAASPPSNPPAWRAGRREIQPTHWLPLTPPKPHNADGG